MKQLVKLEKEMSQVQATYKDAESNYGSELLNLVVAKGYLTKLLANPAVKSYIERREPEILSHLELVANMSVWKKQCSSKRVNRCSAWRGKCFIGR